MPKGEPEEVCADYGGHRQDGRPCQRAAGWGTDFDSGKCRDCRGTSPDGESHEGNQNAMKTGIHSDPVNLLAWAEEHEPEAVDYIFFKLEEYASESEKPVFEADVREAESIEDVQTSLTGHGDELLRIAVQDYARWRGTKRQLQEGLITKQVRQGEHGPYEVKDSNPVNLDLDRLERTGLKQKDANNVSPESDAEQAMGELGELVRSSLQEDG